MKKILDVVFLLDGSSSMIKKEHDILENYNRWIKNQRSKNVRDLYITTVIFRDTCDVVQLHMPIRYMQNLDGFRYYTYGNTAYYDSVIQVGNLMEELVSERSSFVVSEVIFVVLCDGVDNASIWNEKRGMEQMIEEKNRKGWHVLSYKNNFKELFCELDERLRRFMDAK